MLEVFDVFLQLEQEMVAHMRKEEEALFPAIVAMTGEEGVRMPLDEPIACMMHEHDSSGEAVARLRELTNGFEPPPEACNTYRALFAGLRDLEEDLHRHIHLENAVLFPAARALSSRA